MSCLPHPITVLGLGCASEAQELPCLEAYAGIIADSDVLCGGKPQLDMLAAGMTNGPAGVPLLLTVDAKIGALVERLKVLRDQGKKITVLASGDPLFFGIGATLARHFTPQELRICPAPSSMQEACARLALPWHELRHVSLHGGKAGLANPERSLAALGRAARGNQPLCLLIDPQIAPADIAEYLLERGRDNYRLHYFSNLRASVFGLAAGRTVESHASLDLRAAAERLRQPESAPSLIILVPDAAKTQKRPFLGMPDELFEHQAGLITKQPVRSAILAALRLEPGHTLLDLGAGCGSVGLEAGALLPEGQIFSVEKNPARLEQILANRRKFGVSNLEALQGDALQLLGDDTGSLPAAERIFIGGGLAAGETGSGQGHELLAAAWNKLKPGGRLALSCVLLGSLRLAMDFFAGPDRKAIKPEILAVQASVGAPLAGDIQLKALNQVFIMAAQKNL